ncbi:hypothetical protein GCM10009676_43550 [Prauserella halophila]|uniref:histidine kinase n=1 Tax=Prauserella halophila TaxID=185641 RepID=A0ABP4H6X6_9PSEU|nr:nitrate- and nitrite sensing domain-containing protein [Prauserella halophila]MCP2237775.1 Signal transduction histidine kinase [Prauserella halophila]
MLTKPARRSLRGRVLAAALVPSVALLVVGVVVSSYLIYDAIKGRDFVVRVHEAAEPGVDFFGAIRAERRLTLETLAGSPADRELAEQRAATDAATKTLMSDVDGMVDGASDEIRGVIERLRGQLGELEQFRGRVDGYNGPNGPTLQDAYDLYNRIIDTVAAGLTGVARLTPDAETAYLRVQSMPLFTAADGMARADALAAAGHVAGGLSDEEFRTYAGQVGAYRAQLARTSMTPEVRAEYERLVASDAWQVVADVENAFLQGGTQQVPVSPERWHEAANEVGSTLMSLYIEQSTHATNEGIDRAERTLVGALVAGGASLVAGSLLIFFAWRLAQWLVRRLVRLREETLDLADNRLPDLVGRVRAGENVDVVELESVDHGEDEIGQVADAFQKAQRTAVSAAIEESRVREGTKTVFLNIAHRSQVLVHRQLKAIDDAEEQLDDSEQLEMLFRIDHFATRARRNAENLIILGGQQPGRRWRNPVSIADLVRGANAEIEQYRRVDVASLPDVAVIGPAVGDVVHLLAELLDNATAFSPPDSRVVVRGDAAETKGVVLEVEDQGLGIEEEDVERLNTLLAERPDFSFMALSDEPRLGLFVVARLAARHGIQVRLREAIHGGTRAVVRLGPELLGTLPEHDRRDTGSGTGAGSDPGTGLNSVGAAVAAGPGAGDSAGGAASEPAIGWPAAEPAEADSGHATASRVDARPGDSRGADSRGGGDEAAGEAAAGTSASVSAILSGSHPKVEAPGTGWFGAVTSPGQQQSDSPQPSQGQLQQQPPAPQQPRDQQPGEQQPSDVQQRQAQRPERQARQAGQTRQTGPQQPDKDQRAESWPSSGVESPVDRPGRAPSVQDRFLRDERAAGERPGDLDGRTELRRPSRPELSRRRPQRPEPPTEPPAPPAGQSSAPDPSASQAAAPQPSARQQSQASGQVPGPGTPPRPRNPTHHSGQQAAVPPATGGSGPQAKPSLPRRRKQENLAPQLREAPADSPEPSAPGPEGRGANADAARNRFAGFQRGTERARHDQGKREGTGLFASGEGPG